MFSFYTNDGRILTPPGDTSPCSTARSRPLRICLGISAVYSGCHLPGQWNLGLTADDTNLE